MLSCDLVEASLVALDYVLPVEVEQPCVFRVLEEAALQDLKGSAKLLHFEQRLDVDQRDEQLVLDVWGWGSL